MESSNLVKNTKRKGVISIPIPMDINPFMARLPKNSIPLSVIVNEDGAPAIDVLLNVDEVVAEDYEFLLVTPSASFQFTDLELQYIGTFHIEKSHYHVMWVKGAVTELVQLQ